MNHFDPNQTSVLAGRKSTIPRRSRLPLFIGVAIAVVLGVVSTGYIYWLMASRPVATPLHEQQVEKALLQQGYQLDETDAGDYYDYVFKSYSRPTSVGVFEAKVVFRTDDPEVEQMKILIQGPETEDETVIEKRWATARADLVAILPIGADFDQCRRLMRTHNIGRFTYTDSKASCRVGWDLEVSTDDHIRESSASTFEIDLKPSVLP